MIGVLFSDGADARLYVLFTYSASSVALRDGSCETPPARPVLVSSIFLTFLFNSRLQPHTPILFLKK